MRRHVSSGCTVLTSFVCAPGGTRSLSWIFCSSFDKRRTPIYLTPSTPTRRGPRLHFISPAGFAAARFESLRELQTATTATYTRYGRLICAPGGTRTPNTLIRSQVLYPLSYGCNVRKCTTILNNVQRAYFAKNASDSIVPYCAAPPVANTPYSQGAVLQALPRAWLPYARNYQ